MMIMIMSIIWFLGGSLAFGVSNTVLQYDIQSAFAISVYTIDFAALVLAACSFCIVSLGLAYAAR